MLPDPLARKATETFGVDRMAALRTAFDSVRRAGTVSPGAYEMFKKKEDGCIEVVLKP